jgi:hypothetical protein
MYNNYPPGVRESDIPGYDDQYHTEHRQCGASDVSLLVVDVNEISSAVTAAVDYIKRHQERDGESGVAAAVTFLDKAVTRLSYASKLLGDNMFVEADCPFEGEVDVLYGGGAWGWDCPLCGTEHQGDIKRERDY